MFTPRRPERFISTHAVTTQRVSEAAILLSRAFAFVFSCYKVIVALSLLYHCACPPELFNIQFTHQL